MNSMGRLELPEGHDYNLYELSSQIYITKYFYFATDFVSRFAVLKWLVIVDGNYLNIMKLIV